MKLRNIAAVFAAVITLAACQNSAGSSDDTPSFAPADPAATARESAKLIEYLGGLADTVQSGQTVAIDLAGYGSPLLRLPPAAILQNSALIKSLGAPLCLDFPGKANVTVRLANSGGERKRIALARTGAGGIAYADSDLGSLVFVGGGVTLEIDGNITLDGVNSARDGINNTAPLVRVSGGTLVLDGGAQITNNALTSQFFGGGVSAVLEGTVIMRDAEISGCSSGRGGGAALETGSQLTMEKTAAVTNCTSTAAGGGGIYVAGTADDGRRETSVAMKDSSRVSGNRLTGNGASGGGVYADNAVVRMSSDSEISGNEWAVKVNSEAKGGGVTVGANTVFIMQDRSTIRDNRVCQQLNPASGVFYSSSVMAGAIGGGVYILSGGNTVFEMRDESSIRGNICASPLLAYGAGIFIGEYSNPAQTPTPSAITITGSARIEGNAAYILKRPLNLTEIDDNSAAWYAAGSAVFAGISQEFTVDGGAAIPRAAHGGITGTAREAFAGYGIPESWVIPEKSDTENTVALELYRYTSANLNRSAKLKTGADYNPSSPLAVDVAADNMFVSGYNLSVGSTMRFRIYLTSAGVCCWTYDSGIIDLNSKYLMFPDSSALLGTHTGSFTTAAGNTYDVTLVITSATASSCSITGASAVNYDSMTNTAFARTDNVMAPLMNMGDFTGPNWTTTERAAFSGPASVRASRVTLGRFISMAAQSRADVLPSTVPFFQPASLSAYTINANGVIVQR